MASLVPRSLSCRLSLLLRGASVSAQRRLFATDFIRIDPMKDTEPFKVLVNGTLDMCKGLRQDDLHKEARGLYNHFYSGYENGGLSHTKGFLVVAATMQIIIAFTQGKPLDALSLYNSFLEDGKEPNAYMYAVVIKGLSGHGITGEAKKTMIEMMGKRMKPNAATVVALMEGLVREGKSVEGRELVNDMKVCGLMPGDDDIEEVLEGKKGAVVENARNILFPK